MMGQKVEIRRATVNDASLIADLGARTFEAALKDDNRLADMEQYLSSSCSETHITKELSDPSSIFLIAYEKSRVIGYAMLRAGQKPFFVNGPEPVKLVRLYIEAAIIGKGIVLPLWMRVSRKRKKMDIVRFG